jgi:hypothetical protein
MIDRVKTIQLLEQSHLSDETGLWEGSTSEIQDLLNQVRNDALEEAAVACSNQSFWSMDDPGSTAEDVIRALKEPMEPKSK